MNGDINLICDLIVLIIFLFFFGRLKICVTTGEEKSSLN